MKKFFTELWNRFFMESPDFFKILQRISAVCVTVLGLPMLLSQFETELGIKVPAIIHAFVAKAVLVAMVVLWISSKLTVKDSTTNASILNKLPFTKKSN